jgi:hypothetical protein
MRSAYQALSKLAAEAELCEDPRAAAHLRQTMARISAAYAALNRAECRRARLS